MAQGASRAQGSQGMSLARYRWRAVFHTCHRPRGPLFKLTDMRFVESDDLDEIDFDGR